MWTSWLSALGLPTSLPALKLIELHQAAAHFPVGLLLSSLFFDLAGALSKRQSLRDTAFWTHLLGTLGAVVTLALGWFGNPFRGKSSELAQRADVHMWWGFATLGVFVLLALWRVARRNNLGKWERVVYFALALLGALILSITGFLGGHIMDE